ncbi:bifunctional transcriptional activator/DNA repair protein Ada [Cohaesibacter sp. CAU 1516]|uniref:bifunctional transcriptional activator/DNA repair enzyme AdaA n=1 Tax=Cohaesibacter sp. CAU 1516 TaxID=2576038 RepID=UPI0010FF33E6|nr:trifunctional transcriptional activator/DNA repair protein Ada/methylated-DNA--[protein]-cysteine S-methyltransferase [Cohaesibacter sp. CAU 1516]TLP45656.1 bifunctional transcriptional activator/DNA repair protein Ada [Cohaesibacter sp. CAU 1516]
MLYERPTDDSLYQALLDRDPAFDGRIFVAVRSTGIFCRLTCPARKPKRENCSFHESVSTCLQEGFRPCKRCHPLSAGGDPDPLIDQLLTALQADTSRLWREGDIARLGLDPSTVRRTFKRRFGMTFLEMARISRLRDSFQALSDGDRVIDAQQAAGFESASAFRQAFARLIGLKPSDFKADAMLKADWIDTPLGAMIAVSDASHLHLLEFVGRKALPTELRALFKATKGSLGFGSTAPTERIAQELEAYFSGKAAHFSTPLAYHGTPFTRAVWDALRQIPAGDTRTYGALAASLGKPDAVRAVARANGANQIAIVVPCHRILGADGSLTGYGGGLWRKQKLIELEQGYRSA